MRPALTDPPDVTARPGVDWAALLARRVPGAEAFPAPLLDELLPRVLRERAGTASRYSPTEGLPRAREAVARLADAWTRVAATLAGAGARPGRVADTRALFAGSARAVHRLDVPTPTPEESP